LYSLSSTKRVLMLAIGITFVGLLATLLRGNVALPFLANPLVSVSLLIVGVSGVISILLPCVAESYPVRQRGRATGWVAGCSKVGGVLAQALAAALVPSLGTAAGTIAVPTAVSLWLIAAFGHETRGRDLRVLEAPADEITCH
jgi:MFS transporter, putative metabolite:H+ symporter